MCIAVIRAVYQQKGRHDHIAPASLFPMVVFRRPAPDLPSLELLSGRIKCAGGTEAPG